MNEERKVINEEDEIARILREMEESDFKDRKNDLDKKIDKLISKLNECISFGELKRAGDLRKRLEDYIDERNGISRTECFTALRKSSAPLEAAARMLDYPVVRLKDKKDKGVLVGTERDDSRRMIDLIGLDKFCNGIGVGAEINGKHYSWLRVMENACRQFAYTWACQVGVDPVTLDGYKISDEAGNLPCFREFGKASDEDRNAAVIAAVSATRDSIQLAIDAMYGIDEDGNHFVTVVDEDVRNMFPALVTTNKRNYLNTSIRRYGHMTNSVLALVNAKLTGKGYSVSVAKVTK